MVAAPAQSPADAPRKRPWSLTRRMAIAFATTTCAIVLLYGAGSTYLVFDGVREDLKTFMEHELDELALNLELTGGADVERELERILLVTARPPCAFRVRARDGTLRAERGPRPLLAKVEDPIDPGEKWRRYFFTRGIAVHAREVEVPPGTLEILVNTRDATEVLGEIAEASFVTFLLAAVLAGFAGWWMARRGLRGLREVVAQAEDIGLPAPGAVIRVENAPVEVRAVGEALNAMLRRIRQGLSDMRTFTAGLAHELRSPLQNLIGETEVALLSEREGKDYRRLLRSNLEDLHELSDAVDNLVAYCRHSEAGGHGSPVEEFDLAREADIRIARLRRSAEQQGVTLDVHAQGDTRLLGDREGALRVLRNLVGNAIDWSPPRGVVEVRILGLPHAVRAEVRDHGPGIPAELSERVYQPFVSSRPVTGRRAGYGLGLTICRAVMTAHGGSLRHEPAPGGGTRFIAEFPRQPGAPPQSAG